MKRSRPRSLISSAGASSLAKRLHSFISPRQGRLHFEPRIPLQQKKKQPSGCFCWSGIRGSVSRLDGARSSAALDRPPDGQFTTAPLRAPCRYEENNGEADASPLFSWSGIRGSNPPHSPWEGDALPYELIPQNHPGDPGWDSLLFVFALSRSLGLLLASYAGLFIALSFAKLCHDAGSCAGSLEFLERAVKRLVFFYSDFCHFLSPPSHRSTNYFAIIQPVFPVVKCFFNIFSFLCAKSARRRVRIIDPII